MGLLGSLLSYKFISADYAQTVYPQNVNEIGSSFLAQAYIEGSYRPTSNLSINAGVNSQLFALNQSYSVDPRIGIAFKITPKHELNVGYGLHSQTQGVEIYLTKMWSQATQDDIYPNKFLEMTKAHHFVLGHQWKMTPITRLKIEVYYQYLYNLPVDLYRPYYCIANLGGLDFGKYGRVYVNEGTGENVGLEFTLEQFLNKGLYYMTTLSLFDSKFTSDRIYNTRYNGNYVFY
jgi:hypothetical protein